jgi:hypothetical protein
MGGQPQYDALDGLRCAGRRGEDVKENGVHRTFELPNSGSGPPQVMAVDLGARPNR